MNLLETILSAQGGGAVRGLAQNFGLQESQATGALQQLLPALSSGLKRNTASSGGLEGLMGALTKGNHQQYIDDPSKLSQPETVKEGNGILGHLLGSKDVSRQVASRAASQTGLDSGVLKRMLPVVATMVMGSLSKNTASAGLQSAAPGGSASGVLGMLTPMLDADKDGSAVDDVFDMAKKLF